MSAEPLKAGDWVIVVCIHPWKRRTTYHAARVQKITSAGRVRIKNWGLFREIGDGVWRASTEVNMRRATPEEVSQAEAAEAKEKADAEFRYAKTERARAWLAAYDWATAPAWMPTDIATRLGWRDE